LLFIFKCGEEEYRKKNYVTGKRTTAIEETINDFVMMTA
jgi:hypothetical protein